MTNQNAMYARTNTEERMFRISGTGAPVSEEMLDADKEDSICRHSAGEPGRSVGFGERRRR